MQVDAALRAVLLLFGAGFLIANLRIGMQFVRFLRLRSSALLTWPVAKPPYYGVSLALGVLLGALIFVKLVIQQRPPTDAFGEGMMFVYFAYALPLSLKIGRGLYEQGIWAEKGFVPYSEIGGLTWREGKDDLRLILIYRMRSLVRQLVVPDAYYGAVRRLLRDKIAAHDIHFTGKGFDLGVDEREMV